MDILGRNFNVKTKRYLIIISLLIFTGLFLILTKPVSSAGENSYCCERTTEGAWCQSVADPAECRTGEGLNVPVATSCESTSYCAIGTCINRLEGTCSDSPQNSCESNGGTWDARSQDEIPQCQLGCCLIGDQAAFVTQASCNRQSSLYNLDINFRADIKNQDQCLALAFPQARGACVFDDGLTRKCEMLTNEDCREREAQSQGDTSVEFHQGLLCSAESLETICGKSTRTTCVPEKDEVYFIDNCGNLANIYNSSKVDDTNYWTEIVDKGESCGIDSTNGNAGSRSCGNCDYLSGSTCKAYSRGDSATVQPDYGNYVCADLSCEYNGKRYEHGETWCATSEGFESSAPGSESYRKVCYAGEVTTEACASFRGQVCLEEEIAEDFTTASCVVNRFHDCFIQDNKADCEDAERRDCTWLVGETNNFFRDNSSDKNKYVVNEEEDALITLKEKLGESSIFDFFTGEAYTGASCVPNYAPGFKFWEDENRTMCLFADDVCLVRYEKGVGDILLGSDWDCAENCWCVESNGNLNEDWLENRRALCTSLGDCGISDNWLGYPSGFDVGDDVIVTECQTDKETGQVKC